MNDKERENLANWSEVEELAEKYGFIRYGECEMLVISILPMEVEQ